MENKVVNMEEKSMVNKFRRETVALSREIEYDGKKYTCLQLDLDGLTGEDLINAEMEAMALGAAYSVAEMNKTYLACLGAKAAKVPVELVKSLPAKSFSTLTIIVQNFLLD